MSNTLAKPKGLGPEYAAQFDDASVVAAYQHRPPHPDETIRILAGLIAKDCRRVLDVGCGTGFVARPMSLLVERVDALDCSARMIERGQSLPNGTRKNLTWIHDPAETASLNPPYGLIVAGDSLHWMDWTIVLPRLRDVLAPGGYLALAMVNDETMPWSAGLNRLIPQYSTNQDFEPYDLVEELQRRDLFHVVGRRRTASVPFIQSIDAYIESIHARNGFSRERMDPAAAAEFDARARQLIAPHAKGAQVELKVYGDVVWGTPAS